MPTLQTILGCFLNSPNKNCFYIPYSSNRVGLEALEVKFMPPSEILWTIVAIFLLIEIILELKDRFDGWKNSRKKEILN